MPHLMGSVAALGRWTTRCAGRRFRRGSRGLGRKAAPETGSASPSDGGSEAASAGVSGGSSPAADPVCSSCSGRGGHPQ